MTHAPDHPRVSGYAVVVHDGAVLLAGLTGEQRWTLPGGHPLETVGSLPLVELVRTALGWTGDLRP
ncbi:MAG TPA: hypothetical protein DHV14_09150 [Micrococcales bacterium]|uniref:hypothetical protein n=1 Tax=Miniimonas arenae TaxID=676201 RepID=UPI000EE51970|nr:hypothetical protein [Miniimonas arenae]HCX85279.1 hypothetical protein [Micrococcales bacterium]